MFRIKGPVLAAVDFDELSEEVIRQADSLARYYHAELHVCHVLAEICSVRPLFPYLHLEDAMEVADLEASISAALQKTVRKATSRADSDFSVAVEQGTVHSGILRAAERMGAGIVVVGDRKNRSAEPHRTGAAEHVTRHAGCPVLVVKPSVKGTVLAATDFSDPSLPALSAGAAEADRLHSSLTILHAVDVLPAAMPVIDGVSYPVFSVEVQNNILQSSQRELDDCVRRFNAKGGGLLREGPAAEAIVKAAGTLPAHLIVAGTHGRTGLKRMVLGSVAEEVLRSAPCSVLVVRMD